MGASRFVDYEVSAGDYAKHRTPSEARLATWAEAVAPHVRDVDVAVDLGAGTGAFSSALRDWGARCVVAVEPSLAMQAEAPVVRDVFRVTGRAEATPLCGESAGLVWISTAFHHFDDPSSAADECYRVLVDHGCVIIRGFVPGHSQLEWLGLFPGSEKAVARFPDIGTMAALFSGAGFNLSQAFLVEEGLLSHGERAEFTERMRRADSILTAMSDAEVEAGIAALWERRDETERFALSCLIFQKD